MKILIACEYSGKLRDRFIKQGHEVWSCDLLEGEGKHIDRHIVGDYRDILKWFKPDMLIGHPPCTHICVSGNAHYANTQKRLDGIAFFKEMWEQDIAKICLENPVSVVSTKVAKEHIKKMRKKGYKIRVRGSGERAKWSLLETNGRSSRYYDSHLPLKYASHVRLYITK